MELKTPHTWLRAAEDCRPRDRAIVTVLLYTALRLNELVSLDVDDVSISARKGLLVMRSGKINLYREVPLNPFLPAGADQLAARSRCGARGAGAVHRSQGPPAGDRRRAASENALLVYEKLAPG